MVVVLALLGFGVGACPIGTNEPTPTDEPPPSLTLEFAGIDASEVICLPVDCSEQAGNSISVQLSDAIADGFESWECSSSPTDLCNGLISSTGPNPVTLFRVSDNLMDDSQVILTPVPITQPPDTTDLTLDVGDGGTVQAQIGDSRVECRGPRTCTYTVPVGSIIRVNAVANEQWELDSYEGAIEGLPFTLEEPTIVAVKFSSPNLVNLTLNVGGNGTVQGTAGGTSLRCQGPDECVHTILRGTNVRLTTDPAEGYELDSWTETDINVDSFTIEQDTFLEVSFKQSLATLTLDVGDNGTVKGVAGSVALECGEGARSDLCDYTLPRGITVITEIRPAGGYVLDTLTDSSGTPFALEQDSFVLEQNTVLQFTFAPTTVELTLHVGEGGNVTTPLQNGRCMGPTGSEPCTYTVNWGASARFDAQPAEDYSFGSWVLAGDVQSRQQGTRITLTLDDDATLRVEFEQDETPSTGGGGNGGGGGGGPVAPPPPPPPPPPPQTVSLTLGNPNNGSVSADCTPNCGTLAIGTAVSVTAVPDSGYRFVRWECTGSCPSDGTATTVSFTVSQNTTITPILVPIVSLTIGSAIGGSVMANCGTEADCDVLARGTVATVTAVPANGYDFVRWQCSGSCPPVSNPAASVTLTVERDTRITPVFLTQNPLTFNIAIPADITGNNVWDWIVNEATTYNFAAFLTRYPTLMRLSERHNNWIPAIADDFPDQAVTDGDGYSITARIRDGLTWSDGSPLNARDIAFTLNTAVRLELINLYISDLLESVEVVDDLTVKYHFTSNPGLASWQYGVSQSVIVPDEYWAPRIEELIVNHDDPATEGVEQEVLDQLFAIPAWDEPSGGPQTILSVENDRVRLGRNDRYYLADSTVRQYSDGTHQETIGGRTINYYGNASGTVELEFIRDQQPDLTVFTSYPSAAAAVDALIAGTVDYYLSPFGLSSTQRAQLEGVEGVSTFQNPSNGFRYLGFNTRREPFSDVAFRQAVATLIDLEYIANDVLQGAVSPAYSVVPEGNRFWHNPDVTRYGFNTVNGELVPMTRAERISETVRILTEAGYSWSTEPSWDSGNQRVVAGEGFSGPDRQEIEEFEIISVTQAYDPLRFSTATSAQRWLKEAGIPAVVVPTDFNDIVQSVFADQDFDTWVLGWGLAPYPDHLVNLYTQDNTGPDGFNPGGWVNEEFEILAAEFLAATDVNEARTLAFSMQEVLARELPYITLFSVPVVEAYRSDRIAFAYTDVLDGVQSQFLLTDGPLSSINFQLDTATANLTVGSAIGGSVSISIIDQATRAISSVTNIRLAIGATLSVTAIPNQGYKFARWECSGSCPSDTTAATVSLTITNRVTRITPVFLTQSPPLKIGYLADYSGPLAEFGAEIERGVQLAVEQINAAGGVNGQDIEYVTGDTALASGMATVEARRLIDVEGVHAIVGPLASGIALAVGEGVAAAAQIPLISPSATSPGLTGANDNGYLFRTALSDAAQGIVLADNLVEADGVDNVAVVYINNAYGAGLSGAFEDNFDGTVTRVSYEEDATSYLAELRTAAANGAEALVIVGYSESQDILRESIANNLFKTYYFVDGNRSENLATAVGAQSVEGLRGVAPSAGPATDSSNAWNEAYMARYGSSPNLPFVREAYDAVVAIALAAEAANSIEGPAIRNQLRSVSSPAGLKVIASQASIGQGLRAVARGTDVDYEGAASSINWNEVGDVTSGYVNIWEFQNGIPITQETIPFGYPDTRPVPATVALALGIPSNGSVSADCTPNCGTLAVGTTVSVTAVPDSGYELIRWECTGSCPSGTATTVRFTVSRDTRITPVFTAPDDHGDNPAAATEIDIGSSIEGELALKSGSQDLDYFRVVVSETATLAFYTSGSVDTIGRLFSSDGVSVIAANDDIGTDLNFRITRELVPGTYYIEVRPFGSGDEGDYTLHVTTYLVASTVALTLGNPNNGSVSTDCTPNCDTLAVGTTVSVTAVPNSGYELAGWECTGSCPSGTATTVRFTVDRDTTITPVFQQQNSPAPRVNLTIQVEEGGSVEGPSGQRCDGPGTCIYNIPGGTEVGLTARASSGYLFDGWSNGRNSRNISLTPDEDTTLVASFELEKITLSLTVGANGHINGVGENGDCRASTTCVWEFLPGTRIKLDADPNSGYKGSWTRQSGESISGSYEEVTIDSLDRDTTLSVTFTSLPVCSESDITGISFRRIRQAGDLIIEYRDVEMTVNYRSDCHGSVDFTIHRHLSLSSDEVAGNNHIVGGGANRSTESPAENEDRSTSLTTITFANCNNLVDDTYFVTFGSDNDSFKDIRFMRECNSILSLNNACDGSDISSVTLSDNKNSVPSSGGDIIVTVNFDDCDRVDTSYTVYRVRTGPDPKADGDVTPHEGTIDINTDSDSFSFTLTVGSKSCGFLSSGDDNFYIKFSGSDTAYGQFRRVCNYETLTLEVGTGGHVVGIEGNNDCIGPRTCTWNIPAGDRISLEAVPSSDYRFNEWTKRSGKNFSGSGATITISQFDDDTTLAVSFTNYKVCDGDDIHEVIVTPGTSLVYRDGGEVEVTVRFSSDCDVISTRYTVYEDKRLARNPVASDDVSPSSGLIVRDNHKFELTVASRSCSIFSVDNNFYIQFSGDDETHYGQFKRTCDQEMVTLTLEVGTGGHVDGTEGNSDCHGSRTCTWDIPKGERISLEADPSSGYEFDRWRGGYSSSDRRISLTLNQDTTLRVTFERETVRLTLNVGTGGYVNGIEGNSDCRGSRTCRWDIPKGERITLRAIANSGYTWDEWRRNSGERYSGSGATITISSFDDATTLTVSFERKVCGVDDIRSVDNGGTVTGDSDYVNFRITFNSNCGSRGSFSYDVRHQRTGPDTWAGSGTFNSPSSGTTVTEYVTVTSTCSLRERTFDSVKNFKVEISSGGSKKSFNNVFRRQCQ